MILLNSKGRFISIIFTKDFDWDSYDRYMSRTGAYLAYKIYQKNVAYIRAKK
jgi:hypothetical protein